MDTAFHMAVHEGSVQARPLSETGIGFLPHVMQVRDLLAIAKFLPRDAYA